MRPEFRNLKSSLSAVTLVFFLLLSQFSFSQSINPVKPEKGSTQKLGDVILFALPTATVAASLIVGDEAGVWEFAKGLMLTEVVTHGLKLAINKERPDMSNGNAFPSGHTSAVFHTAGYIHRRYGFKYSISAYALAGFTAASRIDAKKHDIVDVIAGAAIGLGSNLLFTTDYQQEHMELTFSSSDGGRMLSFTYRF